MELIDLQPEVDLESAGGYPGEHLLMDSALEPIATEHVGQQHRAHPECRQRCGTASRWPHASVRLPPNSKIAAPASGSATSSQV